MIWDRSRIRESHALGVKRIGGIGQLDAKAANEPISQLLFIPRHPADVQLVSGPNRENIATPKWVSGRLRLEI